ncbi:deoxyribodipyrimidine photo-lyase [Janibacter sp. UYMM211]|uniref:cryptochrome/photolyase family protein n=1 Tax=Janibacter sp. UYMM211 TaxID=3156342 RepID=UPI00339237EF
MSTSILWLRRDLRLHDHPALAAAHADGGEVMPVFVLDPDLLEKAGQVRTAALVEVLRATDESYDGHLVLQEGDPAEVLRRLATKVGATRVHISRETEPWGAERDERVREALAQDDVELVETGTPYVLGPGTVLNGSGNPYKVFTPFAKAWRDHDHPKPCPVPDDLRLTRGGVDSVDPPDVEAPVELPPLGEEAAMRRWADFLDEDVAGYDDGRDQPALDSTSRMSVHLKWGVVHPRTLLADLAPRRGKGVHTYVTELAWREFYGDVLHHNPHSATRDLTDSLAGLRYDDLDDETFSAWAEGRTGYPFVDAGMRQLLEQGWMHNRLRMVTASFLTKDLHCWWPRGAAWFMDHLVDGDVASNQHGWQWVAGTGTDASPYFRVFNPVTQGERFDPKGDYVRRWVPELAHIPGKAVHQPWSHDEGYDHDYPKRLVDHAEERKEALDRLEETR